MDDKVTYAKYMRQSNFLAADELVKTVEKWSRLPSIYDVGPLTVTS